VKQGSTITSGSEEDFFAETLQPKMNGHDIQIQVYTAYRCTGDFFYEQYRKSGRGAPTAAPRNKSPCEHCTI
jgi:hypothetical protein